MIPCSAAATGQDGSQGRDAQAAAGQLPKVGAGAAGFDFTALDALGMATAAGSHDCVADHVTGLVWSAETLAAQGWMDAASAAASYSHCGIASGWYLPTRRELLSIVHHGASGLAIDGDYFPATASAPYWSSDAAPGGQAWAVNFSDGATLRSSATQTYPARYVARVANVAPLITLGANIVVPREDRPGPRIYPGWATGISPGPMREAGQHLTATVELLPLQSGDPKALEFETPPALDLATGDLTFTIQHRIDPDPSDQGELMEEWYSSAGLARVRVTLHDDGGTANGGQDTASAEFTIFLDPAPVALDQPIKHPWKAACIPISFMAMDIDTDPVIADTWHQGDPWPYPTFRILTYPSKGFITDYVSYHTPDGHQVIRFASKDLSFDYLLPQSGMVKVGTQAAAATVVVQDSQPDLQAVMNPNPPRAGWDKPGSLRTTFNWIMTWCYVPFSTTFVGSDVLTFDVTDPDGNVSNAGAINIEIFETK